MAHFAYVVDGFVKNVHVVNNETVTDENGVEQESLGQDFLSALYGYNSNQVIQCSYNGTFRKNYPGHGFAYDSQRDAFIAPQPYDSWILNEETCRWEAPVDYPNDGARYTWDEESGAWIEVSGI